MSSTICLCFKQSSDLPAFSDPLFFALELPFKNVHEKIRNRVAYQLSRTYMDVFKGQKDRKLSTEQPHLPTLYKKRQIKSSEFTKETDRIAEQKRCLGARTGG